LRKITLAEVWETPRKFRSIRLPLAFDRFRVDELNSTKYFAQAIIEAMGLNKETGNPVGVGVDRG
jgi:hypothetical protein